MISGTPPSSGHWTLDPQLARDTLAVGDLALSRLLLNQDANYPWLILVPRRPAASEIIDLDAGDRARLLDEISQVSQALKTITACYKLNVAALGNVVAQLHVHIIARFKSDAAWPQPVWGKIPSKDYNPADRDRLCRALASGLQMSAIAG